MTPNNQTLREIVRRRSRGTRARVMFANTFGTTAVNIGGASIALRDKESAIVAASVRKLTLNGRPAFRFPAGAVVLSDAVDLSIPARADLAIDVFVPDDLGAGSSPITFHNGANQTSYASAPGNHVGETDIQGGALTRSWFLLSRVEVAAAPRVGAIAAFGDSITDGTRSTPDTNNRWPDHLARRLGAGFAVMNVAIAGNRVLSEGNAPGGFGGNAGVNALARFDRDVLALPGVTHVVVMEGINDIGSRAGALSRTSSPRTVRSIERAHARGLQDLRGDADAVRRRGVLHAGRRSEAQGVEPVDSDQRDATTRVIDFEAVVRDPNAPTKIRPNSIQVTTCIRTTQAIRRWASRWTCRCSSRQARRGDFEAGGRFRCGPHAFRRAACPAAGARGGTRAPASGPGR